MLALGAAAAMPARGGTVVNQAVWSNLSLIGNVAPGVPFFVDAQYRTIDGVERYGLGMGRFGVGWQPSSRVAIFGGYQHEEVGRRNGKDRNEERLFAQLSWGMGEIAGGVLASRWRLERRRVSTGRDTGWRGRGMLRYVRPLGDPRGVRALVSAEAFVLFRDTDWGLRRGFDQLRSFAGIEIPLVGKSTAEAGYLNQAINDPGGRRRMNHVASLGLFFRL